MHWAESIPHYKSEDGKVDVTIWAGELNGTRALPPNPNSWAADAENDVTVLHIKIQPGGGSFILPKSKPGSNRSLFIIEGPSNQGSISVAGSAASVFEYFEIKDAVEVPIRNDAVDGVLELLLLQGSNFSTYFTIILFILNLT